MKSKTAYRVIISMVITLFFAISNPLMAQIEVANGEWLLHQSYYEPQNCIYAWGKLFVQASDGLYCFNPADNSILLYNKDNGLNGSQIARTSLCENQNSLIITYKNGDIDILGKGETVYNISDIKNSSIPSKNANDLFIEGEKAYIGTNGNLIELNIKRLEIKDCYNLDKDIISTTIKGDTIFCATSQGLWYAELDHNLKDISNWKQLSQGTFTKIVTIGNNLVGLSKDNFLRNINCTDGTTTIITTGVTCFFKDGNNLTAVKKNCLQLIADNTKVVSTLSINDTTINTLCYVEKQQNFWTGSSKGVALYHIKNAELECRISPFIPNCPRTNNMCILQFSDNRLMAIGSNMWNLYSESKETAPGYIMTYSDGTWKHFDIDKIGTETGIEFLNATCIAQDPENENHYFAGTARRGLYEFTDNTFTKRYSFTNSPLKTIRPESENKELFVSITGLNYDENGNLWLCNNEIDTIVNVIQSNGKWTKLYYNQIKGLPTMGKITFSSENIVIIPSLRWKAGLLIIDTKGYLDDSKYHKTYFLGPTVINQDGTSTNINSLFFAEFDKDGQLWIGTDNGVYIIKDVKETLSSQSNKVERIKVPRMDGTNLADYLFTNVYTTCIAIDAANRKWIGTQNNGLFLIDSDNITTIHNFNTENSPLPSNNIESIAIDQNNGHVYIGTRQGLIVYGGDATTPAATLNRQNIEIYPNPVTPEFNGNVSITGLTEDCSISIVSPAGICVKSGKSNGGMYSWDCTDSNYTPVASGVYTVIANPSNGRSTSAQITIIR